MQKKNIMDLDLKELELLMEEWKEPRYRHKQVIEWLYQKRARAFDDMSNLPKRSRTRLAERFSLRAVAIKERFESGDGSVKFLFELGDGLAVEGVYIPDEKKSALCVSTQVGCKFNCAFCFTGRMGFIRDLKASEIIDQVIAVKEWLGPEKPLTNLIIMGMGEPLDNFDNVLRALGVFTSPQGFKLGARKITLSTVGLIPGLERFRDAGLKVNLAVSLNAVDNETRGRIMPVNKKYPIEELIKFLREYPIRRGRRITFEYVLIHGVNDSDDHAVRLARLLKGIRCKVNLIPFNPGPGISFPATPRERVERFHKILIDRDYTVFTRKSRGADVMAACGQLGGLKS